MNGDVVRLDRLTRRQPLGFMVARYIFVTKSL